MFQLRGIPGTTTTGTTSLCVCFSSVVLLVLLLLLLVLLVLLVLPALEVYWHNWHYWQVTIGTTGGWWLYAFYLRNPKAPHCHQRWIDTPVNMLSLFPSPSLLALLAGQVTIGTTGGWWLYAFYLRNPKAPYCHQRWVDTPVNMLSLFPSPSLRLKLSVLSNAHSNCGTQRPRIVVHDGSAGYVFAYVFKYNQTSKFHYPQQLFSLYSSPTNCSQSTPEAA
jgi:hypothetical protein